MAAAVVLRGRATDETLRQRQPQPSRVVGFALLGVAVVAWAVFGIYFVVHSSFHSPPPLVNPQYQQTP